MIQPSTETITATTTDFAEMWQVEYAIANGLIQFLKAKGMVTLNGVRANATGKGKGSNIYSIPSRAVFNMTGKAAVS